jgi:hypothetical protein
MVVLEPPSEMPATAIVKERAAVGVDVIVLTVVHGPPPPEAFVARTRYAHEVEPVQLAARVSPLVAEVGAVAT